MSNTSTSWYNIVIAASLCSTILIIFQHYKSKYSFWSRKGVKGPSPIPVIGNMSSLFLKHRGKFEVECREKYGKIFGVYRGSKPTLIIADPEVILSLCIKDFNVCINHDNDNKFKGRYRRNFVFHTIDEQWKRMRTLLSPTFTSGKIKRMFKLIDECADDSVKCFMEKLPMSDDERVSVVNAKELFNLYAMDGLTRCCYGLKLERVGSSNLDSNAARNEFVEKALKLFQFNPLKFTLPFLVPDFVLKLFDFEIMSEKNNEVLANRVKRLIEGRRTNNTGKKPDDLLQLLSDAQLEDKLELDNLDQEENHHAGLTNETLQEDQERMTKGFGQRISHKLTEDEIVANATFFLAVGLETTGSLLTHCAYILSFHPEVQERLYEEVKKLNIISEDPTDFVKFDYESLTSCRYLDSVISETLRLMPPLVSLARQLKHDYRIEKYNLDLPKDMSIFLSVYSVHYDPDFWEEPEKFNPERFMPGNKERIVPGSYAPFGLGPRHCLGMRFSLTEAKLGLAKIISYFRFEPAPGMKYPGEAKVPFVVNNICRPLVRLVARDFD